MTYKENIRAILECCFAGFKEELIDSACNRILEQEPCEDCDYDYDPKSGECYDCVKDKDKFVEEWKRQKPQVCEVPYQSSDNGLSNVVTYQDVTNIEPCEDCISRTEAIDKLTKFYNLVLDDNGTRLNIHDIVGTLERLPSVTPVQKWIPVSERLHEEFKSVLVCYKAQGGMVQAVSERLVNMDGSNRWSALAGFKPIAWATFATAVQRQKVRGKE